jgi:hydroxymethylbilane synthase
VKKTIRIATRKSPLALWQANYVKDLLQNSHPELEIELMGMLTVADKMLVTPLNKIGGKGLFVKELEHAILEHRADIAVHSIKDMPIELPDGLQLAVICKREDPRDVLVATNYQSLLDLPSGSILGTSSLRRKAQALAIRPDLMVKPLRGNVGTRLQKLADGEFDAIILAAAGLKRLQLESKIKMFFNVEQMLPAAGQGAIGIECREDDEFVKTLLQPFDDPITRFEILSERIITAQLGGSCQLPVAAHGQCVDDLLTLKALVAYPNGIHIIRTQKSGPKQFAEQIGLAAAEDLIAQGARELIATVLAENETPDDYE